MYEEYIPLALSALAILLVGYWNPKQIQIVQNGVPTGCPNYMWLALIGLIAGLGSQWFMQQNSNLF